MVIIARLFFISACSIVGYLTAGVYFSLPFSFLGFMGGMAVAVLVLVFERSLRDLPLGVAAGGAGGLAIGLATALLAVRGIDYVFNLSETLRACIAAALLLIPGYLGLAVGARKGREFRMPADFPSVTSQSGSSVKILDTSVIIDGRFADICDTGFIEGTLIVPRFVLEELQGIADSSDSVKRSRGRHGLETLNRLKNTTGILIEITDMDFPRIKGVDAKLVAAAKQLDGVVVTNDYNLNKVAELQGVKVLNVNDLANALKPLVLPGESMVVKAIKEGREPGQGVAYLDDGTMVIVDNGLRYLKQNVEVTVTSVLQTTAGRMIFSKVKEESSENGSGAAQAGR